MGIAKKFVSPIQEEEKAELETLKRNSQKNRVRTRAHTILLSSEGFTVNEIAEIHKVRRDTVSSWINLWEEKRIKGLYDLPRPGSPCKLTKEETEIALQCIQNYPNSPKMALAQLTEITGKIISIDTLKRIAKNANLNWKRVRKSLKPKRDEKSFKKGEEGA